MFPSAPVRRACVALPIWIALLASASPAALGPQATPPLEWRFVSETAPEDAPTALAVDPRGGLAVGGLRGVRRVGAGGVPESLLRRGPVADLAFLDAGALLVATGQGLYRVAEGRPAVRETLSPDAGERRVKRLDAALGYAAAATDQGVYLREPGGRWARVRALPSADASLVALRPTHTGDLELWSVIEGELWIVGLRPGDAWRRAARTPLPLQQSEGAGDVAFDVPGADAVLVFPELLAVRDREGAWRGLRPSLPPGARASRIAVGFGRLWLATDAGLLSARALEGPWQRAAPPVGSLPVIGLSRGARLAVATHRGVSIASPVAPSPASSPRAAPDLARIGRLHRSVLRQQGLQAGRMDDLRSRARRRGWLPELHLSVGYEEARDRTRDYDQSFLSGETRNLYDRETDRGRDVDVVVTLSWDLGDAVFHPEEIDVSREARSVIALRDDVLDEVTQLYFERERVLARLAAAPPAEQGELRLRAAELAAGLVAWTGGGFDPGDGAHAQADRPVPDAPTRSRASTEETP